MVNLYVNLIRLGVKTLDDVPANLKMAVETALAKWPN